MTDITPESASARPNRELIALWQAARGADGTCPSFGQFKTDALASFAETSVVCEPLADGDFHCAYVGSSWQSDMRLALTGTPRTDRGHAIAAELARCFRTAVDTGAPMLVIRSTPLSCAVHTWEHTLLPVDGPEGRLLVCNMAPVAYRADLFGSIVHATSGAIVACSVRDKASPAAGNLEVVMANTAAARLFGQDDGALVGRTAQAFIPATSCGAFERACAAVLAAGEPVSLGIDLGADVHDLTITRYDGGLLLTFAEQGALRRSHADLERRALELAALTAELHERERALAELAAEIERARTSYDLEVGERHRLEAELRRLAETDDLTGQLNRRAFFGALQSEVARAARYAHPVSLLYLDIDRFKQINDSRGHAAGDAIIQTALARITQALRGGDRIGRLGGDEFAILLPETGTAGAFVAAERIRSLIADTHFKLREQTIAVTVSVGIATWGETAPQGHVELVEDWVARADRALYAAKHRGRNTVCAAAMLDQWHEPVAI